MQSMDEIRQQIEAGLAQAQEAAVIAQDIQAQLDLLRGRAFSEDREVTVVVDRYGLVKDLTLDDEAMALQHEELSAMILKTVQDANADFQAQAAPILAPLRDMTRRETGDTSILDALDALISEPNARQESGNQSGYSDDTFGGLR